ncbi:hypothetical protein [Aquabacterium sp.]|uniref:hypothetical protein n=1 Tax=Aquabacterium sp. TaxID=1872578 RepID=UPI002CE9948E|nr:hypothetical protein [Aquabacterium sp.]HSW03066.1 hypothetical protein [Aquabacterium sp.]
MKAFRVSDRLIGRMGRLLRQQLGAHPYLAGSIVLHGALAILLLCLPGWGEAQRAKSAATTQSQATQRIAQTELRDLQRRVRRIDQIRRLLDPAAAPAPALPDELAPGQAEASPALLAARAQALAMQAQDLSAAIDAAQRRQRAAELARLAGLPLAEATRQVDAQAGAPRPLTSATPAATIAQLEQHAQKSLTARRAQLAARRDGVPVTRAAPAPVQAVTGSTGQTAAAPGIPRSMADQLAAMARLGPPQGRVGVPGVAGGRSVNPLGVKGVAGGRVARANEPVPDDLRLDARFAEAPPVTVPGSSIDLTGDTGDTRHGDDSGTPEFGADRQHTRVRYLRPPPIDAATLRTGAGRTIGTGGNFATRVYLDSWYVIGPFAGQGARTLQTVYPPEQDVDLDGTYRGLDGRTLNWHYASRGFYPFIPPDRAEGAVYYAYTELRIDEDRDVWLAIAADDDSMLWLDGRLVWTSERRDKTWYHPPFYLRDEQLASLALAEGHRRVRLSRGLHRLLFKLYNEREHSFFSVVLAP